VTAASAIAVARARVRHGFNRVAKPHVDTNAAERAASRMPRARAAGGNAVASASRHVATPPR
jgi:hypothetical protein